MGLKTSDATSTFVPGIEDRTPHWYVAYVKSCQEKKSREALLKLGIDCYLPCRQVKRRWSDRIKVIEQPILPRMIFVRACGERQRKSLLMDVFGLCGYMMDPSVNRPAIVRDSQLEEFRFVVERLNETGDGSPAISIEQSAIEPGDMVEVIGGPLKGMKAECVSNTGRIGKPAIIIRLGLLGAAVVEIDKNYVKKADDEDK